MWLQHLSYGRARVGERAYRQVSGQRGRNVTICLALSPTNGLVYHTARSGGMNRQLFNDFLGEVGRRVNPDNQTFLVFDNAPAHRNADCSRGRIEIKMLPPLFAVPEYCRASHKCFKGCNKSRYFTP